MERYARALPLSSCRWKRFATDVRPATTCPCKAHTEAQAALASWRKAYMEVQAALASWRKAHMEAQAALASGRAPRQALLLDRAAAVREICLRW
jgi:hypothetical protein